MMPFPEFANTSPVQVSCGRIVCFKKSYTSETATSQKGPGDRDTNLYNLLRAEPGEIKNQAAGT
eukprot:824476-Pleurochrysis_carterae.AAC.5